MTRLFSCCLVLVTAGTALGGKLKTFQASAPAHYDKARLSNTILNSEGAVRLGLALTPVPLGIDSARVWDLAEDERGNILIATGDDGKLIQVTPDGRAATRYTSRDSQILSVVAGSDGSVFIGTGPTGAIIRLRAEGEPKVLFADREKYIWSLAYDASTKTLFAATGPNGRIYKIDAEGRAEIFAQTRQSHVLSMARADDGTIYAGTDKQGLVYRISATGRAEIMFQAPQAEVRALHLTPDALYAAVNSVRVKDPKAETASVGPGRDAETLKPAAALFSAAPTSGDNSVYRIAFDGAVREMTREKGMLLGLGRSGRRLLVANGAKGLLTEIDEPTRERFEVARLEGGSVTRIRALRSGGWLIGCGEPARLYRLSDTFVKSGIVTSEPLDARFPARWGAMTWQAEVPSGTAVTVAVRHGNVAEPDETWSAWGPEQSDAGTASAGAVSARYLQYRLTLTTNDTQVSPLVRSLTIRYAPRNQAPEITSLETPSIDAPPKEPKKLKFKWVASDPNDDDLVFDLFVRKDGWNDWVRIEEGLTKSEYEWDTTTMPSGSYRFKLVASDRQENTEGESLATSRMGGPFVLANDAPVVTLRYRGIENGRPAFEGTAQCSIGRLASASFALDGAKWSSVMPADGLFDTAVEKFQFHADGIAKGTHVVVLRVRDHAGNVGAADVVFTVK